MALPRRLDDAVTSFMSDLERFRQQILSLQAQMTSTVPYHVVESAQELLARAWNDLQDLRTRPGVVAYVRNQYGQQASDIGTRATALQTAIATALATVRTGTPVLNPGAFVAAYTLSAGTTDAQQWVYRTVTAAQTAALRTDITAVVAAADALTADLLGG